MTINRRPSDSTTTSWTVFNCNIVGDQFFIHQNISYTTAQKIVRPTRTSRNRNFNGSFWFFSDGIGFQCKETGDDENSCKPYC